MTLEEAQRYEVAAVWKCRLVVMPGPIGFIAKAYIGWRLRSKWKAYQEFLRIERNLILTGKIKG